MKTLFHQHQPQKIFSDLHLQKETFRKTALIRQTKSIKLATITTIKHHTRRWMGEQRRMVLISKWRACGNFKQIPPRIWLEISILGRFPIIRARRTTNKYLRVLKIGMSHLNACIRAIINQKPLSILINSPLTNYRANSPQRLARLGCLSVAKNSPRLTELRWMRKATRSTNPFVSRQSSQ